MDGKQVGMVCEFALTLGLLLVLVVTTPNTYLIFQLLLLLWSIAVVIFMVLGQITNSQDILVTNQHLARYDKSCSFCTICNCKVGVNTKHCGACNKCVSDFDHHCPYLNNCIGGSNYKFYFCLVISYQIHALLMLVHQLIIALYTDVLNQSL